MATPNGRFFAVSREQFHAAADLGLGPLVAYLVIACGTGRSHARSKWSANAVAEYTGINHRRSRAYIEALEEACILVNGGTRATPIYELAYSHDPIWLPNVSVTGLGDEDRSPLFRIRQAKDVDLLRLYVDLYDSQNLGIDGGISPEIARGLYLCSKEAEFGALDVYAITSEKKMTTNPYHPVVARYWVNGGNKRWWHLFKTLMEMGLVVSAINLYDGPVVELDGEEADGEYLLTLWGPTVEERNHYAIESRLEEAVGETNPILQGLLNTADYHFIATLPRHVADPEAVGVYRMLHTAQTKAASTWWAKLQAANRDLKRQLGIVSHNHTVGVDLPF